MNNDLLCFDPMLSQVPEKTMHIVRWFITCGWLLLIISLFYDPLSIILTDPQTTWSPFRLDPDHCVLVQGDCFPTQPYPMGASLFWGLIVPLGVLVLLVFGHEFWRRICPLGFLSQIPRALGKQRQITRKDEKTGKIRTELAKIKPDSWLGRNHTYVQFAFLYVGICGRLLFFDSHRLILGIFLLSTISLAILIGYLFAGKSWCQYFCPMAPVQLFYAEPRGLITSVAHQGDRAAITQSMCRRITEGKEQSACVACQSPCFDIDAERSYWDHLKKKDYKFLYYSYAGLAVGYFLCYYLYAGNWNYLLSGAWARQDNQLDALFSPAIYIFGTSVLIPRIIFIPLFIGMFCFLGYQFGKQFEKVYKTLKRRNNANLTDQQLQHQIYTIYTFVVFNLFFVFGGRSYVDKLPIQLQYCFNILIVLASTLWVYRTWGRSSEIYSRESLASRLRKQLIKLKLDVSRFLEGRSIESLNPDEVYVLAKILPGFTGEKRMEAYKGVLRESLEEGYVNSSSSLEVLQQMRQELGISEAEHQTALTELGVENPALFDPNQQRSRENQLRLQSFRQQLTKMVTGKRRRGATGLGKELLKVVKKEKSIGDVLQKDNLKMRSLSQEYGITSEEEAQILSELDPDNQLLQKGTILLNQLQPLWEVYQGLQFQPNFPEDHRFQAGLKLLMKYIENKQRVISKGILDILTQLSTGSEATYLGLAMASLAPSVVANLIKDPQQNWSNRLDSALISRIDYQAKQIKPAHDSSLEFITEQLHAFLSEPDSLTKAVSLYLLSQLNLPQAQQQAQQLLDTYVMLNPLVKEIAQQVLDPDQFPQLTILEKLLYLSESDLFSPLKTECLIDLAYHAQEKTYAVSETILEQGELNANLLLLVKGVVQSKQGNQSKKVFPITLLNYLDILGQKVSHLTLISNSNSCILAIEGAIFDELLTKDKQFVRTLLQQNHL